MLLVLVTGMFGYYPVFKFMQYRVWREMEGRIKRSAPDELLQAVSPSENEELEWLRGGKELRYKGEMFDVVRTGIKNGKTVYYCLKDSQEEHLFESLEKSIKDQLDEKQQGKNGKSLLKIYFALYYYVPDPPAVTCSEQYTPAFHYSILFSLHVSKLNTPPPEHC